MWNSSIIEYQNMKILPFVTSILDSWHTKLCTSDLGEHVFSFSASGWQNGKKSKRMTRKANFGGSYLFSWVMGPHRAPQPLSTGRGSVSAPHQAKWNRENLQQPDSNPKVPSQEWWKKKKKGIWSLKLGNLWWICGGAEFLWTSVSEIISLRITPVLMCCIPHICFNLPNAHLQTQPACRSGIKEKNLCAWLKSQRISDATVVFKNWAKIALYWNNSGKLKITDSGF